MCKAALPRPLASAFVVLAGPHGDISKHAQQRGVCRQRLYRETAMVLAAVDGEAVRQRLAQQQQTIDDLRGEVERLQQQVGHAVVVGPEQQACFAATAQAEGVSLPVARRLLHIIFGEATPSVAQLGRYSKQAQEQAGAVLAVLDPLSRAKVEQVCADEIFVGRRPVLMQVEPDSLCWVGARLSERRDGEAWAKEFACLPQLQQVLCDAGTGLEKGVEQLNQQRQDQGQPTVARTLDHFHLLREGTRALRRLQGQASAALEQAERAEAALTRQARQGRKKSGFAKTAKDRWQHAETVMDHWRDQERLWRRLCEGLGLFTATGQFNDRRHAEALVADILPQLQGWPWKKVRRYLTQPDLFSFLDRLQGQLAAVPQQARQAALCGEQLQRQVRSARKQGQGVFAALLSVLVGLWQRLAEKLAPGTMTRVRTILAQTWRGSSAVEGLNSVLRMQQSRHRRLSQGLLDLKRLYWNCRPLRTGKRKGQRPYQRLGLKIPVDNWWELLKIPPEQLRRQMSALAGVS